MKKLLICLTISLVVFTLEGCGAHRLSRLSSEDLSSGGQEDKVMDAGRLTQGGRLLLLPFSAGENAAATPQLDSAALMIVKGIADALQQARAPFQILTNENAATAELILDGFIEDYVDPGTSKKWLPHKTEIKINVKAKLFDHVTKKSVIFFNHSRSASTKNIKPQNVAYQLGQELGQSMIDAIDAAKPRRPL